jgi:hypothetical protein
VILAKQVSSGDPAFLASPVTPPGSARSTGNSFLVRLGVADRVEHRRGWIDPSTVAGIDPYPRRILGMAIFGGFGAGRLIDRVNKNMTAAVQLMHSGQALAARAHNAEAIADVHRLVLGQVDEAVRYCRRALEEYGEALEAVAHVADVKGRLARPLAARPERRPPPRSTS